MKIYNKHQWQIERINHFSNKLNDINVDKLLKLINTKTNLKDYFELNGSKEDIKYLNEAFKKW